MSKVKKYIISITIVILLVMAAIALAKEEPNGQPFQTLWNTIKEETDSLRNQIDNLGEEIDNLQEQIDNIELIPGPDGPQGPPGPIPDLTELEARITVLELLHAPPTSTSGKFENFDSYNNGDLNGQGGWSGDTEFDIQGTVTQSGAKAVIITGATDTRNIDRSFAVAEANGNQVFYAMASNNTSKGPAVWMMEGTNQRILASFRDDGNIKYHNGTNYVTIATYSANVWYRIEIEWRASDNKARYRIDGGAWTNWDTAYSAFTSINGVRISYTPQGTVSAYWDSFSDPNAN